MSASLARRAAARARGAGHRLRIPGVGPTNPPGLVPTHPAAHARMVSQPILELQLRTLQQGKHRHFPSSPVRRGAEPKRRRGYSKTSLAVRGWDSDPASLANSSRCFTSILRFLSAPQPIFPRRGRWRRTCSCRRSADCRRQEAGSGRGCRKRRTRGVAATAKPRSEPPP